jgi:diadenosine tetraphosphate (Ap4A) HIT family hydrolase
MGDKPLKVLFAGNVQGQFDALFSKIERLVQKKGPFDALFCVGTFFARGAQDLGELEPYLNGAKSVPVPTYFIGKGTFESDMIPEIRPGAVLDGPASLPNQVTYLGPGGVATIRGLKVAFLDNCYDMTANELENTSRVDYSTETINGLKALIMDMEGDLDLLLTNDWPEGADIKQREYSSRHVAEIALLARPRYHIASMANKYYQRLPYVNEDKGAGRHVTRFIGLASVANLEKRQWMQALALVPCEFMKDEQFRLIPKDATTCPYIPLPQKRKHAAEDANPRSQSWRWEAGQDGKKQRMAAPSYGRHDIVKDRSKTIFVRNVPFAATEEDLITHFSTAGTVADIVRKATHEGKLNTYCHIQFSTREEMEHACQMNEQELMGRKMYIEPALSVRRKDAAPVEGCWFCLSNPNADIQLVCSVGQESYIVLDKGPINGDHVLVLPIEHHACSVDLPESTLDEVARYLSALSSYYASQGKVMVGFERFMRLKKSGGNHCHINVIGVDGHDNSSIRKAFEDAGRGLGHTFTHIDFASDASIIRNTLRDVVGDGEYFCAILPDGSRLVHPLSYGERHPLSFGREVLAGLAGAPERSDWKACKMSSQKEEEQAVELFKNRFKSFDVNMSMGRV